MSQKQIPNIELPDDLESQYVNFVRISHTASEFVLDFSLLLPGVNKPQVDSRLVMSPFAAKLFLRALTENLKRYETNFGEITVPGSHTLADDLFRPGDQPEGS
ncbi:MAG: DUF3467 domain-containing protein [Brevefilum sp.]|jgi:hypothetical protein|nr:DUF3467 domain-containing protein [Brevefilum sp.]